MIDHYAPPPIVRPNMTNTEPLPLFPDEPPQPEWITVAQVGEIPEGEGR